jgi:hypothetical protein
MGDHAAIASPGVYRALCAYLNDPRPNRPPRLTGGVARKARVPVVSYDRRRATLSTLVAGRISAEINVRCPRAGPTSPSKPAGHSHET